MIIYCFNKIQTLASFKLFFFAALSFKVRERVYIIAIMIFLFLLKLYTLFYKKKKKLSVRLSQAMPGYARLCRATPGYAGLRRTKGSFLIPRHTYFL